MAYVITNNDGSYIYKDGTGRFLPIRSHNAAFRFETEAKANNIWHNCLSKEIRKTFYVVEDSYELPSNPDEFEQRNIPIVELEKRSKEETKRQLCYRVIDGGNVEDWCEKINEIVGAVNGIKNRNNELNDKLSNVDKEIVDIEHYIEFGNFNAYQGWVCFKILQNMLRQRRNYKNELEVLKLIKDSGLGSTASNLSTKISESQNKSYSARVFADLFRG